MNANAETLVLPFKELVLSPDELVIGALQAKAVGNGNAAVIVCTNQKLHRIPLPTPKAFLAALNTESATS